MSVHPTTHTAFPFPLQTLQPQAKTWDYCGSSSTVSQAFTLSQMLLISLTLVLPLIICPRLYFPLKVVLSRLYINSVKIFFELPSYCLALLFFPLMCALLCLINEHPTHILLLHTEPNSILFFQISKKKKIEIEEKVNAYL